MDLGSGASGYVIVQKKAEHDLNFNIEENNGQLTITDLDASEDLLAQLNEGLVFIFHVLPNCLLNSSIN